MIRALQAYPRLKTERGFSLVEFLVAVAIFTVVASIAVGALMSILDANLKTRSQKLVFNNLTVAVEGMVRNIRSGDTYQVENVVGTEGSRLRFQAVDGTEVVYQWVIDPVTGNGKITRSIDGASATDVTANTINITTLSFEKVAFSGDISNEFDKVLVTIHGEATTGDVSTDSEFTLQTTVSQNAQLAVTNNTPTIIQNDVPYCPIPKDLPGLVLIEGFEEEKTSRSVVSATRNINYSSCYTGSSPSDPPYNHRSPARCGCSGQFHPGWGGDLFCPGYNSGTDQKSPSVAGSHNRWRAGTTNGYPGLAPNELRYPEVGESFETIPSGEYQLVLAAWDSHCDTQTESPPGSGNYVFTDCSEGITYYAQQQEKIYAEIELTDGTVIQTTPTSDIPCGEQHYLNTGSAPDSSTPDIYDCVNFNTSLDYVGTMDTRVSNAQLAQIDVFHAGCETNPGGDSCNAIADGSSSTGYRNNLGIEVRSSGKPPSLVGGGSTHSVVAACLGLVCVDGDCLNTSSTIRLPEIEI